MKNMANKTNSTKCNFVSFKYCSDFFFSPCFTANGAYASVFPAKNWSYPFMTIVTFPPDSFSGA